MNPEFLIIHHSLTEDGQTVSWQAIRHYHTVIQGWKDIGYHYGIELVGFQYEIFKGRMDNEDGAHCIGFNDKSIGICLVGNFDKRIPSVSQRQLLKKLCNSLMEIYGIKTDNVLGHWETYPIIGKAIQKTCPGVYFNMPEFRKML